jgi:hypothetical protein
MGFGWAKVIPHWGQGNSPPLAMERDDKKLIILYPLLSLILGFREGGVWQGGMCI